MPGSLAYMIDLVGGVPPDEIAFVAADSLSSQRSVNYDLVETVVEPLSYTLDVNDFVPITFLVANRGLVDVEVTSIVAILLDEQGFPHDGRAGPEHHRPGSRPAPGCLAPAASRTVTATTASASRSSVSPGRP